MFLTLREVFNVVAQHGYMPDEDGQTQKECFIFNEDDMLVIDDRDKARENLVASFDQWLEKIDDERKIQLSIDEDTDEEI